MGQKKNWVKKICIQNYFCLKKQVGLTQWGGYMTPPPPESSRVKIVLGCCWYCWLTLPTKFQTPRIISSINGLLPSKVVFHQRSSSIKGRLPSKAVFHQRLSSIKNRFPSILEVVLSLMLSYCCVVILCSLLI